MSSNQKTIFIISPIGSWESDIRKRSDTVKRYLIDPIAIELNYATVRADEINEPGAIDNQIINHLLRDDIVVADLTDHNPNVFYELAVRHSVNKPVILLMTEGQTVPFDLKTQRIIFYNITDIESFFKAKGLLKKQIESIESNEYTFESPISLANRSTVDLIHPIEESIEPEVSELSESTSIISQVFIVHGHDEEMKQHVARIVIQLGLQPIILHEQPNRGRTIIEKFEDYSDVGYAIVLLSPDDIGGKRPSSSDNALSFHDRARQNVIFELGYFIGQLGRDRVTALYRPSDKFEFPSDYSGVIYTKYDSSATWRFELVRELQACGYEVSADTLLK